MSIPMEVSCRDVKDRMDRGEDFFLLDCREASEYETARIAGATLLPMSEIAMRVEELRPQQERTIVVHCHHGARSLRVANWLRQQGFSLATSMAGGIDEWSTTIDPAVPRY